MVTASERRAFDESLREGPPHCVVDRLTGAAIELTAEEFTDLSRIQLADWLEHVGSFQDSWDYGGHAYRAMAEHVGGQAPATYEEVFFRRS